MVSSSPPDSIVVTNKRHKNILLSFSKSVLTIYETARVKVDCPLEQVLWAEATDDNQLHVSLLHRPKKFFSFYSLNGGFDSSIREAAERWSESLMKAAYAGCQPRRRFMLMINPRGGPGKAMSIFLKKVKPIFEAAHCSMDVLVTDHNRHCYHHTRSMSLDYDAIVLLSGDGLVHEVFNGFADREDSKEAFKMPVIQIPTGSANGFSISILGLKDGHDVCAAALNAIKGKHMKLDLCSVRQGNTRIISFMSQAVGMMADIDLGTENLRWMGDTRFMIGFFRAVSTNRGCPMKLEVKVAARDKQKMVQTYRSSRSQLDFSAFQAETTDTDTDTSPSTQLGKKADDSEEWTLVDKHLSYVYGGKMPYVSRTLMQFPVALCNDGLIDIVAQERVSRLTWLKGLDGAAEGKAYWKPSQLYFKAKAYRLTPLAKEGYLSIDGEGYPYAPFEVEVLQRLGTTLGHGGWFPEFCP